MTAERSTQLLVAWRKAAEPVVPHRSLDAGDAVTRIPWTDDGSCLAWVQGGRLWFWDGLR